MDLQAAKMMIEPIYNALTEPASKNTQELIASVLPENWISYGSAGVKKNRSDFINMISGLGKLIPDLTFTILDIVATDERIVVRSEAKGTPKGEFMGVPASGKSFSIMTIDFYTIKNDKHICVHHVEDWMTAVRQLSGK